VALGAGVRVSVAAIGLGIVAEISCRHVLASASGHATPILCGHAHPSDEKRQRAYFARRLI
jgi:hypothetical protein